MTRQRVQQRPPKDADLSGFPARTHEGPFFRAARQRPWWFGQAGDGRFDLTGGADGTLYAGTDLLAGVIEVIGPEVAAMGLVQQSFLAERSVWALAYDRSLAVADTNAREAIGFGVTNELSTMVPYEVPQRWATALHDAGFDGVAYRTRFDTGPSANGLALFDAAGAHDWPAEHVCAADAPEVIDGLAAMGVMVTGRPVLAQLQVIE